MRKKTFRAGEDIKPGDAVFIAEDGVLYRVAAPSTLTKLTQEWAFDYDSWRRVFQTASLRPRRKKK